MFMSAKTVSSDIIPTVKWKGNRLYYIFAMKVAFSSFFFSFQNFCVNISPVLKSEAFKWCEEWLIVFKTIFW